MKLFIEAYPTPPLPEVYGEMKDKCKLIASRLELKSEVNPEEAGLHTLVIKEKKSSGGQKQPTKESGKSTIDASSSSTDIQATINKAVQSAMKAFTKQQTLVITKDKAGVRKQPVANKDSKCPHCHNPHLGYRPASKCWNNPDYPITEIPESMREKVMAKRKQNAKGKTPAKGGESSSGITEMAE